jgi:hypothetical protein
LDVETKVVVSGEPAKLTWAPGANPVPAIVMLKDPIGMVEGVMPVTAGCGFRMVTAAEFDVFES